MSRSLWKLPYVNFNKKYNTYTHHRINLNNRSYLVSNILTNKKLSYNSNGFFSRVLNLKLSMIGYPVGAFLSTRKFVAHKKLCPRSKKKSKRSKEIPIKYTIFSKIDNLKHFLKKS